MLAGGGEWPRRRVAASGAEGHAGPALASQHVELRAVALDHPDSLHLVAQVQQEYVRRYGGEDWTPMDPGHFVPPRGLFLVGYVDGQPVVCGGWRAREAVEHPNLADGDAEIKRMYVAPDVRGRGLARALLAELERTAAAAGRRRMVLETGQAQPEAIALYLSSGYAEMAKFGVFSYSDTSVCYAKPLLRQTAPPGCAPREDAPTGS